MPGLPEKFGSNGRNFISDLAGARPAGWLPEHDPQIATREESAEFHAAFCDHSSQNTSAYREQASAIYASKSFEGSNDDTIDGYSLAQYAIQTYRDLESIAFKLSTGQIMLAKSDYEKYYRSLFPADVVEADHA